MKRTVTKIITRCRKSAKTLVGAISLFLMSCSTVTVHMNTRYIDTETQTQLADSLERVGFNVETNQLPFPDSVSHTSLIYSPLLRQPDAIDLLATVLKENQFNLHSSAILVESNQWFTKNNIGLFPVPYDVDVQAGKNEVDLVDVYQASDCQTKGMLQLSTNGRFTLTLTNTQPKQGNWQLTQFPYVAMTTDDLYHYAAEIKRYDIVDKVGPIQITKIEMLDSYKSLNQCNFESGTRY